MNKAVYPGSFDPLTNGHLDIIKRASKIFDKLYVLVSFNINKKYAFKEEERVEMIRKCTKDIPNLEVVAYDGLVVEFCKTNQIPVIIRGMRNYQDYEQEFSLYQFNKEINPNVETLMMLPSASNINVSSSAIKELIHYNQDISKYVPKEIAEQIIVKLK